LPEPPTAPDFSPFFIAIEMRKAIEIREPEDQKKTRKKMKMQRCEKKMPRVSKCCLLNPRKMNSHSIRALHVLRRIRSKLSLQINGTHL